MTGPGGTAARPVPGQPVPGQPVPGQPVSRRCVFSMGSNQGDSLVLLQRGVELLAGRAGLEAVTVSPVYRTRPVGPVADQPDFLNLVLLARSASTPEQLLARCHEVEAELGRVRLVPGGPRTLDVDLVVVGDQRRRGPQLVLPHPRAHERGFVLVPWHDVDPAAELPGHGPVSRLLAGLDLSGVEATDKVVHL